MDDTVNHSEDHEDGIVHSPILGQTGFGYACNRKILMGPLCKPTLRPDVLLNRQVSLCQRRSHTLKLYVSCERTTQYTGMFTRGQTLLSAQLSMEDLYAISAKIYVVGGMKYSIQTVDLLLGLPKLIRAFLKAVVCLKLSFKAMVPQWDLESALGSLCNLTSEVIEGIDI